VVAKVFSDLSDLVVSECVAGRATTEMPWTVGPNSSAVHEDILRRAAEDSRLMQELDVDIGVDDFQEALASCKALKPKERRVVAEMLAESFCSADMCAQMQEDEVSELLATVDGVKTTTALVRRIIR
jgi:hypothetical protein